MSYISKSGYARLYCQWFLMATILLGAAIARPAIASPYIVFDQMSGRIYAHNDAFDRWYPASLTKMMTVYTVFREIKAQRISLLSPIRISKYAQSKPASKIGFPVGTIINVDTAIKLLLVKSANDIATAIAESVGGSEDEFVALMNQNALRLGMFDSHFVNPHGLHDVGQYSSARDLAVLASEIYREFPQYVSYFSIPAIKLGGRTFANHNKLMQRFAGTTGMKTGYICEAGLNIVAAAKLRGRTFITVVLGEKTGRERNVHAAQLLTDAAKPALTIGFPKLDNFKAKGAVNKVPVDMRPAICVRKNKRAKNTNEEDDSQETSAQQTLPLKEREARYYKAAVQSARVVPIVLGNATGPDPFGLLTPNPNEVLVLADEPPLEHLSAYSEENDENNALSLLQDKVFDFPGIGKVAIPTPRPQRPSVSRADKAMQKDSQAKPKI